MDLRPPAELVASRARTMWAVQGGIVSVILVVAGVVTLFLAHPSSIWIVLGIAVIAVVFVCGTLIAPVLRYRIHRWEVTEDAVYTQRGLLTIEQRIAPISRVQTVDTERGVLERLFGLSSVTVTTASAKGELRIEGLDADVADRIVHDLTVVTAASEGDAT
ncbi:MAG TPA: PH domain-containing protein [Flexivirga sp.]|uniref:PH domain-containing protein n=1 Tax=Flexivirga sp. TaxID=1962927 RepID=UPI002B6BA2E4|nr:PH domain-containing protein [Flexivirga sp.]HWC24275.1 PH domain-containing protein [Flexivirga sp.]